jgi:hypothetical protein
VRFTIIQPVIKLPVVSSLIVCNLSQYKFNMLGHNDLSIVNIVKCEDRSENKFTWLIIS